MSIKAQPRPNNEASAYTFSSEPKAVQPQRKKFRDPGQVAYNIMYDPRIVRGSTYGAQTLPTTEAPDPIQLQKQAEMRRITAAKRRAERQKQIKAPDAVEGRKHIEVQTELYLEELSDIIPEADAETQTDAFLDRLPSPLYIPQKSGIDASTEILEGELFDFDSEVETILEVLVGKTIEQALMEVVEEEELKELREHQERYEERRNAELAETMRLEEAERRRDAEKHRRLKQEKEYLLARREAAEKVAARVFAQTYLSDLVPCVMDTLTNHGYFYDAVQQEMETEVVPWLMQQVKVKMNNEAVYRQIVKDIIANAIRMKNQYQRDELIKSA